MKRNLLSLFLCTTIFLSGCNDDHIGDEISTSENTDQYFNISEIKDKIEKSAIDVGFTDFKYDESPKVFPTGGVFPTTLTPSYFMINDRNDKKWIDFGYGQVQSICDIPGCDHGINTDGCLEHENRKIQDVRGAADGVYFQIDGESHLYFKENGGSKKTVFENTFYTDFEEEILPDNKTTFSYFMRDSIMYVIGQSYMYMVDIETMTQISDPFIISHSRIWNADVSGNYFWISNEHLELICCNTKTGEITKTADKIDKLQCVGDRLYYITANNEGKACLYVRSIDPLVSDDRLVLENVDINFYAANESIYYISAQKLYKCGKEGENSVEIPLSFTYNCGEEYKFGGSPFFYSTDSCDSIFVVDYSNADEHKTNAIFVIKKDSTEYQTINMGIWEYLPNSPDGKVEY